MIFSISVLSVVISPFSFLILLIWFFSLFFLMSLANGLSILFIFSKNQLLVLLIFAIVSFVSFSFISALTYMISFLILTLGFFFSFSSCFRCKIRLFISCFSLFLRSACIAMNLPLSTAFTEFHRFSVVMFSLSFVSMHIFISFFISSVICWLVRSVLFSLHMFVFLIVFFPCSWHLILLYYDQKRCLKCFQFFEFTKARFMALPALFLIGSFVYLFCSCVVWILIYLGY